MTDDIYTRSVELKKGIEHAEKVLKLLNSIAEDEKISASISEAGFLSRPEHILLDDNELAAVIKALADEIRRLKEEFARL